MNFYLFDERLRYDCELCNGLCCNLNGELTFSVNELSCKEINIYHDFFYKRNDLYFCKTPKRCWFLENNKCSLGSNKPLCCKLYPLQIWALNDTINIVEIVPCPTIYISDTKNNEYNTILESYEENFMIHKHQSINKILNNFDVIKTDEFLDLYNIINNNTLNSENEKNEKYSLFFLFYKQIFMHPYVLNIIDDNNIQYLTKTLDYIWGKYNSKILNIQNLYIIVKNDFCKFVLFHYYKPCRQMKGFENIIDVESYYNDINKYKMLNNIYNSSMVWRKF